MSVSSIVTVWCDGCQDWAFTGFDASAARASAKRGGWAVNLPPTEDEPRKRRDLCPRCRASACDGGAS